MGDQQNSFFHFGIKQETPTEERLLRGVAQKSCHLVCQTETNGRVVFIPSHSFKVHPSVLHAQFQPPEPILKGRTVVTLRDGLELCIHGFFEVLHPQKFGTCEFLRQFMEQSKVVWGEVRTVGGMGES